jgi:hypothetical protein
VNTVGDVCDGDFFFGNAGPDMSPHFPAHFAVEARDAVAVIACANGEHGHGEEFISVEDVFAAKRLETFEIKTELVNEITTWQ